MAPDDIDAYETALRRLPEADEVVCGYLHIELEGLETLFRVAEDKLNAELHKHRPANPR